MPVSVPPSPPRVVRDWSVRLGRDSMSHSFGREVPLREAVREIRAYLDILDPPLTLQVSSGESLGDTIQRHLDRERNNT